MPAQGFPDDFLWGAATSAQQIEGGRYEDGRGESIWDRFASTPGKIADGSNSDLACDHYHLWRGDVERMAWLGLNAYRFSISWPRIVPAGRGAPNPSGLDFYDALVDRLLEAGIRPFPTLFHWDLPQDLQDRGGWAQRDTVSAFLEYSATVVRRLGDRVKQWVTHNEPWCIATLGYEEGHHAPGHHDPAEALRVAHHLLLSHGRASAMIRSEVQDAELGLAVLYCPTQAVADTPADHDAARWLDGFFNRWYLDPIFRGSYPVDVVADRIALGHLSGPELPFVQDDDMAAIAVPLDFLGVNYYSRVVVKAGPEGRPVDVKMAPPEELTDMGWEVYPAGLEQSLARIHQDYAPPEIYITENGAAYDDPIDSAGRITDSRRINYLREHLRAAQGAIQSGVPLKGYFAWSLLDNFEWGFGYEKRFGLFAVDHESQQRIPKDSAFWYRDLLASKSIDHELADEPQGESRESES